MTGSINLAKIKAAHKKLRRLDPEYSEREQLNSSKPRRGSRLPYIAVNIAEVDVFEGLDFRCDFSLLPGYENDLDTLAKRDAAEQPKVGDPSPVRRVAYEGKNLTVREWSDYTGVKIRTIGDRISRCRPTEEVLGHIKSRRSNKPVGARKGKKYAIGAETFTVKEWCDKAGQDIIMIRGRLRKGWALETALTTPRHIKGRAGGRSKALSNVLGTGATQSLDTPAKQDFFQ